MNTFYKTVIAIVVFLLSLFLPKVNIETFNNYTGCIEDGYLEEYCMRTPMKFTNDNDFCSCSNGFIGEFYANDGKCYCRMQNGLLPNIDEQPFESTPF